ncbi:hypothetical protein QJS04_geneDACA017666 [Acorus gramineus]|uniref:Transmembrane protein 214 n=1 Tax=Acorus gramineus TaxID=55184 RepID=A0AAV9AVR6_ACOGR|nr:hypothetical protein QJS04_geneDACA017666 [Acorus gramineus]
MEEDKAVAAAIEASLLDMERPPKENPSNDHGWQKVVYPKRQRRARQADSSDLRPNGGGASSEAATNVFSSVEQKAEARRRAIDAQKKAAAEIESAAGTVVGGVDSDDSDDSAGEIAAAGAAAEEVKKPKVKKPKKPKVTVADAASAIDASELETFLVGVSASYEAQPDIQLLRFADHIAGKFSAVSAGQFPWTKMFKESPVSKIIDVSWESLETSPQKNEDPNMKKPRESCPNVFNIPICHVPEAVYRIAADWIGQRPADSLGKFVVWSMDKILDDLASQQSSAKGSKKSGQQPSSKSQVPIFLVLALTLRRKPDILISLLPMLRDDKKYQGHDKLPVIIWVIGQAAQVDPVVGMFAWVHNLLPLISGKSSVNPQSRDLVLQLAERILAAPKAKNILLNGVVRKGERLVPPSALELLMLASFPAPAARIKATERFESVYPILKELALTGSPGTKALKQVSQQLFPIAVKALRQNNPILSQEAADIFIWCLTQNSDCYKQWEKLHLENAETSTFILRKLSEEWKVYAEKLSPFDDLRETLMTLREKNEEALADGAAAPESIAFIRDSDKYCKAILAKVTRKSSCMKFGVPAIAIAIGATIVASKSSDWNLM